MQEQRSGVPRGIMNRQAHHRDVTQQSQTFTKSRRLQATQKAQKAQKAQKKYFIHHEDTKNTKAHETLCHRPHALRELRDLRAFVMKESG